VIWNGSSLVLGAVNAAAGFTGEIHDNDGSRVRVDFESDDAEHRVEVRVEDGRVEVRID
jgi:hypothetical protein